MKQDVLEPERLSYSPCRYGASRMLFRGPRKRLDQPYLAFVGGTETYGKFIEKPFPALVEKSMRQTCVNFGCVNGGIDAFVTDKTVLDICHGADLTVVQVMGANLLSNRFFTVHPRRNDRFVQASTVLKAIYPEVDFSDFAFTRHMLGALRDLSFERFDTVVNELQEAWLARMRTLISEIGENVILMWFAEHEPTKDHWSKSPNLLQDDPLFINRDMLNELRPAVKDIAIVKPSDDAVGRGTIGMVYPISQQKAAQQMLGVDCHKEAASLLLPKIRDQLYSI